MANNLKPGDVVIWAPKHIVGEDIRGYEMGIIRDESQISESLRTPEGWFWVDFKGGYGRPCMAENLVKIDDLEIGIL